MADDKVRPEVVEALLEATQDPELSQEHFAELAFNATERERAAVAELHGQLADLTMARARAEYKALRILADWWYSPTATLGAILKVVPPDVASDVVRLLAEAGYSDAADWLPRRPDSDG